MNGDVEVDMKSVQLDTVEASAGRRRKKRGGNVGGESLAGMLRRGIVDHQLGLSLNVILLVAMSWCLFPSLREKLEAGFLLSYKVQQKSRDGEGMYGQGRRDIWLVVSLVVVFTSVRAFMLDYVLMPLGGLLGIRKKKGRVRYGSTLFESKALTGWR
jgi:acyl-CoA-dependent ceramide synthase